ncbi:MAG: HD domain-containing protein [Firmicutes bacterium]|nr:HD domain-containing protein [Bacillota bacterium]
MSIEENMKLKGLSEYATKDSEAIRLKEEESDIRPPFFRDIDRVLYSSSYTRYIDKTQVFSFVNNDHISKRIIHVQFVSKIARTIGRALGLNIDLIEAAALGHDLGHVPFGHVGERILNDISLKHNEGYFNHNIESVRILMNLENNGIGKNITVQVLDAIMCHNGEFVLGKYEPKKKTVNDFLDEYNASYHDKDIVNKMRPMTLEGCVVRISDVIGYIGRDIEDAITLGIIEENDIPKNITETLGKTNREIINTIVNDVINNSVNKPYIMMSDEIFNALVELKKFNYKNIYAKANTQKELENYEKMYNELFNKYLDDLNNNNKESSIYRVFLKDMTNEYLENTTNERKVIDFIAGMTDDYFINCYKSINN